ncbi:hypothetical protein ACFVS2_21515 [Brevibacillus sp. NPDC058079]|uniref:hypothetical protein n=1 Tax=Brevibacillus sp. NPDC058079 TaxID=3346330 RepID=UPI0036E6CE12
MKQVLNTLKSKAGFISIETVIVAGLMIALGAYAVTQLYMAGQSTTEKAIDNVNKVLDVTVS